MQAMTKIILSGQDPLGFLQRLITQDVRTATTPKLSALCNAYGKVLFIFWVQNTEPTATIWVDGNLASDLQKRLQYYDPFSSLDITLHSTSEEPLDGEDPWPLRLIKNNILTLAPETQQKFTPHILRLDEHNALSFTKGCFVGYEPIARTHRLGKVKRKLAYQVSEDKPDNALNTYHDGVYHSLCINPVS